VLRLSVSCLDFFEWSVVGLHSGVRDAMYSPSTSASIAPASPVSVRLDARSCAPRPGNCANTMGTGAGFGGRWSCRSRVCTSPSHRTAACGSSCVSDRENGGGLCFGRGFVPQCRVFQWQSSPRATWTACVIRCVAAQRGEAVLSRNP